LVLLQEAFVCICMYVFIYVCLCVFGGGDSGTQSASHHPKDEAQLPMLLSPAMYLYVTGGNN